MHVGLYLSKRGDVFELPESVGKFMSIQNYIAPSPSNIERDKHDLIPCTEEFEHVN